VAFKNSGIRLIRQGDLLSEVVRLLTYKTVTRELDARQGEIYELGLHQAGE